MPPSPRHRLLVISTVLGVLLVDQLTKFWVKTHMVYGEEIQILGRDWALIHFVENNGMAFGLSFGGMLGKLLLSLFRIGAVAILIFYLRELLRKSLASWGQLFGLALILAGAIGNIIDSAFYGLLFSESSYHGGVAEFLPANGGYAPFLFGRVVDMFYFPIAYGTYPDWFPFVAGEAYLFFRPVFNVADVAICVGVGMLLSLYLRRR